MHCGVGFHGAQLYMGNSVQQGVQVGIYIFLSCVYNLLSVIETLPCPVKPIPRNTGFVECDILSSS